MNKVVYLCPHCKSKHASGKEVELCRIAHLDDPTGDEILQYVTLREELKFKDILKEVYESNPKH